MSISQVIEYRQKIFIVYTNIDIYINKHLDDNKQNSL